MPEYSYEENNTNNKLEFTVDNNNVIWINNYYVDPENVKLFVVMLKNAFNTIISNHKCDMYMQYVSCDDWNHIKGNDNWKICKSDDALGIKLISCNASVAPQCILDGFLN